MATTKSGGGEGHCPSRRPKCTCLDLGAENGRKVQEIGVLLSAAHRLCPLCGHEFDCELGGGQLRQQRVPRLSWSCQLQKRRGTPCVWKAEIFAKSHVAENGSQDDETIVVCAQRDGATCC